MTRVAAVDIGTNSCRLLIAQAAGLGSVHRRPHGFRTIDRQLRLTRLGQGVDQSGDLAEEAITRTATALGEFAELWRAALVSHVRITATSAARDAGNGQDLLDAVFAVSGVVPQIISGEEEAALAFAGATAGSRPAGSRPAGSRPAGSQAWGMVAVLDIGGGSTEVIVGTDAPQRMTSRQVGCVRLTERVLVDDPPSAGQIRRAEAFIAQELERIQQLADPSDADRLIAVAGTVTTLAAVHLGLEGYTDGAVHGTVLSAKDVDALSGRLLAMTTNQIAELGAVQAGREDVLAAGALILAQVVRRFGFSEVHVSEMDSLDGSAMALLRQAAVEDAAGQQVEVVDARGNVLDVVSRATMRAEGLRHRCTYVAVVRSTGRVVVHKRADWKDVFPGAWDLAFGGVCDLGEPWETSAARELQEEAGITGVGLHDLGAVEWSNGETALIGRAYVTVHDGPLAPDDGEVVALDEVPIEQLQQWLQTTSTVDDSVDVMPPLLKRWWTNRA